MMRGLIKFVYDVGCVFLALVVALGVSISVLQIILLIVK